MGDPVAQDPTAPGIGLGRPELKTRSVKRAGDLGCQAQREPRCTCRSASDYPQESTARQPIPPGLLVLHDNPPWRHDPLQRVAGADHEPPQLLDVSMLNPQETRRAPGPSRPASATEPFGDAVDASLCARRVLVAARRPGDPDRADDLLAGQDR